MGTTSESATYGSEGRVKHQWGTRPSGAADETEVGPADSPITLYPLSGQDALRALLRTRPAEG